MAEGFDVAIVGGGFTGLAAAFELSKQGCKVCVVDADAQPGGLAGTFEFADGVKLEKFYHHWFNNDDYVPQLVDELGLSGEIVAMPTRTGMFYNGRMWKLSSPMDLLRFSALSLVDRIRLGLVVLLVRRVKDWHAIEHLSIREWLEPLCGKAAFRVVWSPLISSKFSVYAEAVNAVWMWKKLVLRGSTRNDRGGEELCYFKGGFGRLADELVKSIERRGSVVRLGERVTGAKSQGNRIQALLTTQGEIAAGQFLFTPAFPVIGDILEGNADSNWLAALRRVRYLGNICLVLRLRRSLSDTYWVNVNDAGFPFVGVIEHTNFDTPDNYRGTHIAYLSRYVAAEDEAWGYDDAQYLEFALEHLKRMFPELDSSWLVEYRVWRTDYAQPITERDYSRYVPGHETPFANALISTMAQIYPEDRGTNYAIRDGRAIARRILDSLEPARS